MNLPISGSWLLQRFDVMQAYPVPWHHSDGRTEVSSSGCPDCPAVLQRCHKHKSVSTVPPGKFGLVHCGCHSDCFFFSFCESSCGSLDLNQEMHPVRSKPGVSSHHQLHISEKQKLGMHLVILYDCKSRSVPSLNFTFRSSTSKQFKQNSMRFPVDMAYKLSQDEHGKTA